MSTFFTIFLTVNFRFFCKKYMPLYDTEAYIFCGDPVSGYEFFVQFNTTSFRLSYFLTAAVLISS